MFCFGPHIALFHFHVPATDYVEGNKYFRNFKGFGGNLTFQIYTATLYTYFRLQYSYDMYSGDMKPLRSLYPGMRVGLKLNP
jgi:hypothetical protein